MNFKLIKDFFKNIKIKKQNNDLNITNKDIVLKKIPIIKQLKK